MNELLRWLIDKGMSQAELARRLHFSAALVSYIIAGKKPVSRQFRRRFRDVFGDAEAGVALGTVVPPEAIRSVVD